MKTTIGIPRSFRFPNLFKRANSCFENRKWKVTDNLKLRFSQIIRTGNLSAVSKVILVAYLHLLVY